MTAASVDFAIAWMAGLNARLAGQSLASNPYRTATYPRQQHAWREGWLEAENAYGIEARGRWPVRPLPHADRRAGHQGSTRHR